MPYARYGHTGVYVELNDTRNLQPDGKFTKRKYLFIYGGFAFECQTACYDLWKYEIPWAPINYYPTN